MIATDEEGLAELFETAIIGITPRKQYKGAEGWKPHDRETSAPTRTRRFRLLLRRPRLYTGPGGAAAGNVFEHECELRVRTEYAGEHAKQQFILADDFMQLRDVLSNLRADDNGVLVVEPVDYRERPNFDASSDVTKIDHIFNVRYMRSIRP
jgi:hypothetical protein